MTLSALMVLSLLTGRNFSKDFGSDEESVMFNEEAVKLMGFRNS